MTYTERLAVPASWWLLAAGFVASLWLALAVALPGGAVWSLTAVAALLAATLLLGYGGARITVGPDGVAAGRALLDWPSCGAVASLDAERTRDALGAEADARAYLVTRPYLRCSVRLEVSDDSDPTPYWLVSTRHPERLVAAVEASRPTS